MGIISAKGRSTGGAGDGGYEDFLQTDAAINHGNSGGALVSTKGELVGINSQILSNSEGNIGIGFAIPVDMEERDANSWSTGAHRGLSASPVHVTGDLAAAQARPAEGAIANGGRLAAPRSGPASSAAT
jgi:S1-C subfamily serine protease